MQRSSISKSRSKSSTRPRSSVKRTPKRSSKKSSPKFPLVELPDVSLIQVLLNLQPRDLSSACATNKRVQTICKTSHFKKLYSQKWGIWIVKRYKIDKDRPYFRSIVVECGKLLMGVELHIATSAATWKSTFGVNLHFLQNLKDETPYSWDMSSRLLSMYTTYIVHDSTSAIGIDIITKERHMVGDFTFSRFADPDAIPFTTTLASLESQNQLYVSLMMSFLKCMLPQFSNAELKAMQMGVVLQHIGEWVKLLIGSREASFYDDVFRDILLEERRNPRSYISRIPKDIVGQIRKYNV